MNLPEQQRILPEEEQSTLTDVISKTVDAAAFGKTTGHTPPPEIRMKIVSQSE